MYLAEMIEIYHVDEKSSFELDRLVQSQGQIVDLITKCGRGPKTGLKRPRDQYRKVSYGKRTACRVLTKP